MNCPFCQSPMQPNQIYCPVCGKETQMVDDSGLIEDELLRMMLREAEDDGTKSAAQKENSKKKKQGFHIKKLWLVLILCIAVLAVVFGIFNHQRNNSETYLLEKAQEAYDVKDYDKAEDYVEKVLKLNEQNIDALLLAGQVDVVTKDYETAEVRLTSLLQLDPSNAEGYRAILELYTATDSYEKILNLCTTVSDEEILEIFDEYMVHMPEADNAGGAYDSVFTIHLDSDERDVTFYYTLDGSVPDAESEKYDDTDGIEITTEGEITLLAIAVNADGHQSRTLEEVYSVEFAAPEDPVISPDGGTFTSQKSITVTVPDGSTVYYTWDNTTPDENSSKYKGSIKVKEGNNVLSVIAISDTGKKSNVVRSNFIYYPDDDEDDE